MHSQIERLIQDNDSLRNVSSSFQSETESLLKEQDRLQNCLREKDTQILSIHDTISQQEKHSVSLCDTQLIILIVWAGIGAVRKVELTEQRLGVIG